MPSDEMTQREAVRRAARAAALAEEAMTGGSDTGDVRVWVEISRAWTGVASQLPLASDELLGVSRYVGSSEEEGGELDNEPVTEFIPRIVEPLAAPLCYCDHGHAAGHPRTGLCR